MLLTSGEQRYIKAMIIIIGDGAILTVPTVLGKRPGIRHFLPVSQHDCFAFGVISVLSFSEVETVLSSILLYVISLCMYFGVCVCVCVCVCVINNSSIHP